MKIEEILNDLCYNTMGNPKFRIDKASDEIKKAVVEEIKELYPHFDHEHYECRKLSDIIKVVENL